MSHTIRRYRMLLLGLLCLLLVPAAAQAEPLLEQGDRMVFLGDSITQQQIYTRYVMNYFALRYPDLGVSFRNAGVSGDDAVGGIVRMDEDVFSTEPDVVSVCFGMNDARYQEFEQDPYDEYVAAMTVLAIEFEAAGVKPVLLTPGCVDSDRAGWLEEDVYNQVLRRYADAVEELATKRNLPVYDIHELMLDVQTKAKAADPEFTMIPDAIHPDPPGQLLMAYALIVALNAETPASGLEIDAADESATEDRCEVRELAITDGSLSFFRRDEALPVFFDPEALTILEHAPELKGINSYPLKVTGLAPGSWVVTVQEQVVGTFTHDELAAGVDLGALPGPWRTLGEQVNEIHADQERIYLMKRELTGVFPWIPKPAPEAEVETRALMEKLGEVAEIRDHQVRDLVDERTWRWSLRLVP